MFQSLNSDVFYYLINQLHFRSILSLASCSSYFYRIISQNEEYWQLKCRKELPHNILVESKSWKSIYMRSMNVFTFGSNHNGVLGFNCNIERINTPTKIPGVKYKDISVAYHTLAIDLDDNVWSFGSNISGQLGLDSKWLMKDWIPRRILVPGPFFLGCAVMKGIKAKCVETGFSSSAIIDLDNNVWTFGSNHCGQLGLGDVLNRYAPVQILNADKSQCLDFIQY